MHIQAYACIGPQGADARAHPCQEMPIEWRADYSLEENQTVNALRSELLSLWDQRIEEIWKAEVSDHLKSLQQVLPKPDDWYRSTVFYTQSAPCAPWERGRYDINVG